MKELINIKQLSNFEETEILDEEFARHYGWYRKGDYFKKCLEENQKGTRITLMAFYENELAGCCHFLYNSNYPFFRNENIPEINDLNVFPEYRRKKIASRLFDELERIASKTSRYIGLGVGLYKDYGNAQRMYCKRGYVMDGNGMTYKNKEVHSGQPIMVDDDLLVYLLKELY